MLEVKEVPIAEAKAAGGLRRCITCTILLQSLLEAVTNV